MLEGRPPGGQVGPSELVAARSHVCFAKLGALDVTTRVLGYDGRFVIGRSHGLQSVGFERDSVAT